MVGLDTIEVRKMIKTLFSGISIKMTIAIMGSALATRNSSPSELNYKDRLGIFDDITNGNY